MCLKGGDEKMAGGGRAGWGDVWKTCAQEYELTDASSLSQLEG